MWTSLRVKNLGRSQYQRGHHTFVSFTSKNAADSLGEQWRQILCLLLPRGGGGNMPNGAFCLLNKRLPSRETIYQSLINLGKEKFQTETVALLAFQSQVRENLREVLVEITAQRLRLKT